MELFPLKFGFNDIILSAFKSTAHGVLYVSAETINLAAQTVLFTGPLAAGVLGVDLYKNANGQSLFTDICGKLRLFVLRNEVTILSKIFGVWVSCAPLSQKRIEKANWDQAALAIGIAAATPVVYFTLRKISQGLKKLNTAF